MESPLWLPPLNSHEIYATIVSISQSNKPMTDKNRVGINFRIRTYVDVAFYSQDSKKISLKGLSVRHQFFAPTRSMVCSSQETVKNTISAILCNMHVPFELDQILYTERHLKESRNQNFSPEDSNSWVVKFQNFLVDMSQKSHNAGHNILPFNLRIKKIIMVSPDEFKTWISWFREKERVDPNFRRAYLNAVSRPRTIQELLEAENLKCEGVQKSSLAAFKDASLGDESNSQECMVCLENFSPGCEACWLPCSHVFHKSCIHKWLYESKMCPLCRSSLTSD